ncbi:MAG: DUF1853 family protein [Cellvibrionaceae bacterium]|nr:DUF1853 family protein [Cellvibrionaceae bacterium]
MNKAFDPNGVLAQCRPPHSDSQAQRELDSLLHGPELIELQQLAQAASPLPHLPCPEPQANSSGQRRLGLYAEDLLAGALTAPNSPYQMLARNLQVAVGPARRTLGEFDFIVRERASGLTAQLELACKYYLGLPAADCPSQRSQWLGPNCNDRLDKKIDRLLSHQLTLGQRPEARALLQQQLGLAPEQPLASYYLLRGRLYYPAFDTMAAPAQAAPGHLRGLWCSQAELPQFVQALSRCWSSWGFQALSPLQLLAPQPALQTDNREHLIEFVAQRFKTQQQRPIALALHNSQALELGLYVVDDDWPERAAKAMTQ